MRDIGEKNELVMRVAFGYRITNVYLPKTLYDRQKSSEGVVNAKGTARTLEQRNRKS